MIICILGPTGVGKTKLSVELAKKINGEIINADSTQVFKNLNIATAKVTKEEMEDIPHHLFDIKEITDNYTVYDYQKDCRNKIDEIISRKKTPIMVGGTGLYIKAALYDYKFEEEYCNNAYAGYTTEELYKKLTLVDKNTNIHPNNRKRIIRALNYFDNNNLVFSSKEKTNKLLYDTLFIELITDRDILYNRINNRVDEMIKQGLIKEAKEIYNTKVRSKAVMTPIGYKELFDYFDKKITLDEAIELIKKRSRHYAKRQITWNNHQMNTKKFSVNFDDFDETVKEVLTYINSVN